MVLLIDLPVSIQNTHFINKTPCERIDLIFCKFTLGAKKISSNIGVRAELGRIPMEHFIMTQSILYLSLLHSDNVNPLLKETLILSTYQKDYLKL
jgi:hypothetical protein